MTSSTSGGSPISGSGDRARRTETQQIGLHGHTVAYRQMGSGRCSC